MNKKHVLLFLSLMMVYCGLKAQPMQADENLINVGIGIPSVPYNSFTSKSPAFSIAYHRGISDKIGIGYISAGAQISFYGASEDYRYSNIKYTDKYHYTTIVARAAYHFDFADLTGDSRWDMFDIYAGPSFGITSRRYTNDISDDSESKTYLTTDIYVGANYNFYENLAFFVECGLAITYLNTGIAIKF